MKDLIVVVKRPDGLNVKLRLDGVHWEEVLARAAKEFGIPETPK